MDISDFKPHIRKQKHNVYKRIHTHTHTHTHEEDRDKMQQAQNTVKSKMTKLLWTSG